MTSPWRAATPYPTSIYSYAFAQNGDDFYIISGSLRRYNVTTDTWTSLADIPVASLSAAVYYDGKIYALSFTYLIPFDPPEVHWQIYDVAINTWSEGTVPPDSYTGGPQGYIGAYNGNIYVAGNFRLLIYNVASNSWSTGPAPPTEGPYDSDGGYTQVGQYLYIVGGLVYTHIWEGEFNGELCKRLDMVSNTWSVGPAWTMRRKDFALAAVGNKLIAIGGDLDFGGHYDGSTEVDELDTSTWPNGTWKRTPYDLPSPRAGNLAGFVSNSRVGGEVWTTGGARLVAATNSYEYLNEHLFLPAYIQSGGSSIVAAGPNGALDPGETVTVSLGLRNVGAAGSCTTAGLSASLLPGGGVINPPGAQNYGVICGGDQPVFRNFTFTVDPNLPCGRSVTPSLVVTDGDTSYTISYTFPTDGKLAEIFSENFDGVTPPALPTGWTSFSSTGQGHWTTSSMDPETPPNDASIDYSPLGSSTTSLDSPTIPISSDYAIVSFRHSYSFDNSSSNGHGEFEFFSNGIGFDGENWIHDSNGYITSTETLGPNLNGTVQLAFYTYLGRGGAGTGWRIDTLSLSVPVCEGNPLAPMVIHAASRKTHGAAGPFDIDLPIVLLENAGIENRNGLMVGQHQIVVTFANPVTIGATSVITGVGSVANSSVNGAVVTINLTGVTDAQRLGVMLSNVSDGQRTGNIMIPMGVLSGDTNASGTVNSSDLAQIKSQSGQPITHSNFREDVNANGAIDAADVSAVKLKSGAVLP